MSLFGFNFLSARSNDEQLPELFPLAVQCDKFTKFDLEGTYLKILTDTFERTHGITKAHEPALWDNCVQSEAPEGLISMLANAMANMADLYIVYKAGVIRRATPDEVALIRTDYEDKIKGGKSSHGVHISFRKYSRTEWLKVYSGLEYCVLSSLNKSMNLAKAVQVKIHELRKSVAAVDADVAKTQGKAIAKALADGRDVMIDAEDQIEVPSIDMDPTEKAMEFLNAKRAFVLSLPSSYISGDQTPGIGSTGEADMRAVERGLKQYFVSIVRPACKAIFNIEAKFKSQDFRQVTSGLEALKTFALVKGEGILSLEAMQAITARMFDLDPDNEAKALIAQGEEEPEGDVESAVSGEDSPVPRFGGRR